MSDLFQLVISCGRLTSIAPDPATPEAKHRDFQYFIRN
jgi:hypothetical protein